MMMMMMMMIIIIIIIIIAAQEAGSAAELAATRKLAKYSALGTQYMTSSQLQWRHWVL